MPNLITKCISQLKILLSTFIWQCFMSIKQETNKYVYITNRDIHTIKQFTSQVKTQPRKQYFLFKIIVTSLDWLIRLRDCRQSTMMYNKSYTRRIYLLKYYWQRNHISICRRTRVVFQSVLVVQKKINMLYYLV